MKPGSEYGTTLLFVYNADSGLFNTLTDIAHKVFSPDTYECHLCALTYGTFSIREEWRTFLESLDVGLEFLHRDEFAARYEQSNVQLPAIFILRDGQIEPAMTADTINECTTIDDLKKHILEIISP